MGDAACSKSKFVIVTSRAQYKVGKGTVEKM